jgi:hypothetical protein
MIKRFDFQWFSSRSTNRIVGKCQLLFFCIHGIHDPNSQDVDANHHKTCNPKENMRDIHVKNPLDNGTE